MENRILTGRWYLKKGVFGYTVMVETLNNYICKYDFSTSPDYKKWEKAKPADLYILNIKCE